MAARERRTAWTDDRIDIPPDESPFASFPQAAAWVRSRGAAAAQLLVHFVGPTSRRNPHFALSADGDMWTQSGAHHRLPALRSHGGSFASLVARTSEEALP